ncbi:hypothetical protein MKY25_08170 [Geobacillus sp. FSL W8-0032]|uniref:hypothetical protein n=1 Tax=Geobacillus TaxID=129337 RepID=UPI000792B077|nr:MULTISPECIES: hypothetical protein [Geobacillus]KYD29292.1 hypothetical protein B4113_2235 [Geobacillus sp. B4113_201601]
MEAWRKSANRLYFPANAGHGTNSIFTSFSGLFGEAIGIQPLSLAQRNGERPELGWEAALPLTWIAGSK